MNWNDYTINKWRRKYLTKCKYLFMLLSHAVVRLRLILDSMPRTVQYIRKRVSKFRI